jgi:hypothetical protein
LHKIETISDPSLTLIKVPGRADFTIRVPGRGELTNEAGLEARSGLYWFLLPPFLGTQTIELRSCWSGNPLRRQQRAPRAAVTDPEAVM